MNPTKSINTKVRQNVRFLHTSRLALGNLWKTLDVRVVGFALAGTKWGIFVLHAPASIHLDRSESGALNYFYLSDNFSYPK